MSSRRWLTSGRPVCVLNDFCFFSTLVRKKKTESVFKKGFIRLVAIGVKNNNPHGPCVVLARKAQVTVVRAADNRNRAALLFPLYAYDNPNADEPLRFGVLQSEAGSSRLRSWLGGRDVNLESV